MKNLLTRTITSVVFLAIMLGAIYAGLHIFSLLSLIFTIIGLYEFSKFKPKLFVNYFPRLMLIFSGVMIFSVITLSSSGLVPFKYSVLGLAMILPCLLIILFSKNGKPLNNLSNFILGMLYVSVPFALLTRFYFLNDLGIEDFQVVLGFFIILWCNDVFAYLIGSAFGRTKLYEKISPKKTWEGTIGGVILSVAAAYVLSIYFWGLSLQNWLVLGAIISIFGSIGDLFESSMKRKAGIKDSGKIMPGHGGILDRFDGMIFAAPAVYVYLNLVL